MLITQQSGGVSRPKTGLTRKGLYQKDKRKRGWGRKKREKSAIVSVTTILNFKIKKDNTVAKTDSYLG